MSHKKPRHQQASSVPAPSNARDSEQTTKRHVYVEPGVQIDLVKDFREKYERSQDETTGHNKRTLRWAKIGTLFALVYALVTGLQLYDAHKNFKTDERAWVGLKTEEVHLASKPTANGPQPYILGNIVVYNTGKSLARSVTTHVYLTRISHKATESDLPEILKNRLEEGTTSSMLLPGNEVEIPIERPVVQADFDAINQQVLFLYVIGEVEYIDIAGDHHRTRFCGRYWPLSPVPGHVVACTEGMELAD